MASSRSTHDILASMLQAASVKGGTSLSRMVYSCGIPYSRLKKRIDELILPGLLEEGRNDRGVKTYMITERGKMYLELYSKLNSLLSIRPREVRKINNKIMSQAIDLLESCVKDDRDSGSLLLVGKRPASLRAAAYYITAIKAGESITQSQVARLFGITGTTMKKATKLLEGALLRRSEFDRLFYNLA